MLKFGKGVVKSRIIIFIAAILLLIPSVLGYLHTRVNYDILSYLPEDIETMKGQDILVDEFGTGAFSTFVVDGMSNKDVSALKNIENVKGDETFTQGTDGTLIWQADGNDIYYQGTTDKELPINMKMTYYLDGEEIAPEDLAGKSGKVTIRMDYTNKEKTEDGVYVPFAAVTGMMLNKDFTNVEVTNGKVISDGNNQVVVGFAFPGLSESLDLDSKDLEDVNIPDYVEVTADEAAQAENTVNQMFAKDGETYQGIAQQAAGQYKAALTGSDELQTKVENGVSQAMYGAYAAAYKQLNYAAYEAAGTLGSLESDAAAFASQMTAASASSVTNVSSQLISGIADGTSSQIGGMAAEAAKQGAVAGAKSGIASTKSAIASQIENGGLVSGAQTLSAGVQKLYSEGIQPLAVGMQSLNNSVPELMKGIQTLSNGAAILNNNSAALKSGVNTLNSKGSALNSGVATLDANSGTLNDGATKLKDGAKTLSDGMIQFDEEGIQKLSDAYHGDVEELLDRVDLVLDAGENYHTFSGLKDDMSGSVKFVIRTEAIEK